MGSIRADPRHLHHSNIKKQNKRHRNRSYQFTQQNPHQIEIELTLRVHEIESKHSWRQLLFDEQEDHGVEGGTYEAQALEDADEQA